MSRTIQEQIHQPFRSFSCRLLWGRVLYSSRLSRVNRQDMGPPIRRHAKASYGPVVPWIALLMAVAGCRTASPVGSRDYVIAVRYNVEPVIMAKGKSEAITVMQKDFEDVAAMGFDGVVLDHISTADWESVAALVHDAHLEAFGSSPAIRHYVHHGIRTDTGTDNVALLRTAPRYGGLGKRSFPLVISGGPNPASADRARTLCEVARQHGVSCLTIGDRTVKLQALSLVPIDIRLPDSSERGMDSQRWLSQFHKGLRNGQTAGLVVDRYRRPPGDPPGLSDAPRPEFAAQRTAIRSLLARAARWGPLLQGMRVEPMADLDVQGSEAVATVFARGLRRYVLLSNADAEQWFRGSVTLPESIAGRPVTRAVEQPASGDRYLGRVFDRTRGQVRVSITLRPGDAVLYEIF